MYVSTGAKIMIWYISKHASAVSFWVLQYLRALNVMLWIFELAFELNFEIRYLHEVLIEIFPCARTNAIRFVDVV